jgi:iron complex transport system permease protein
VRDLRAVAPATRARLPLTIVLPLCGLLLAVVLTAGVGIGPVPLSSGAVWDVLLSHLGGHPSQSVAEEIVWQIRVPRVLLAALIGAALTTAGTVVQVLVRNALADPFLLGFPPAPASVRPPCC